MSTDTPTTPPHAPDSPAAPAPAPLLTDRHLTFVAAHQPPRNAKGALWAGEGLQDSSGHGVDNGDADHDPGTQLVQWVTDAIFASGIYWGLHIEVLLSGAVIDKTWVVARLLACRDTRTGGFAGSPGHDPHVLYTYSAIQALILCDVDINRGGLTDCDGLVEWVASLQDAQGAFSCDEFGDTDTRYTYAALATLRLLGRLDAVDCDAASSHVLKCQTMERAFGARPGAEAHAGQTFCSVAALALCDKLHVVANDVQLHMWLSERQNTDGGTNGRPGKRSDVCYAWWVGATAAILKQPDVLDRSALIDAILGHQSPRGGLAAHRGDKPDLFHTHFGLAALSVLGYANVASVDPIFCLPHHYLNKVL
eukprot:m.205262 g.205262  ORF g.205262 m.205262 type:complete len:365 (+) comp22888_c0_seq1:132-1226(+)